MEIPVSKPHRFDTFDAFDLQVMHGACVSFAADILADAEHEDIDREALPSAAGTFLRASLLSNELADYLGDEHPENEDVYLVAQVIAEGDAPLAAKHAAEVEADGIGHPYYPDSAE